MMALGCKCLIFLGICMLSGAKSKNRPINVQYSWSRLEFDYPSEEARQKAIETEQFIVGRPAPIDIDVYYADELNKTVFVTVPRFRAGVPATLGTVTTKFRDGNPVIAPYPSWEWHTNPTACSANRIVSVYRIKIDECGRLWILDNGRLINQRICSAQILAFDLKKGNLVHRYEIPDRHLQSNSLLVTPIVDVRDPHGACEDTYVYIADSKAMSLIVHDVQNQTSWHITDKTMYPYPNFGTFEIMEQEFDLMDGILGMDISPYKREKDRILYYHAMTSGTENWVSTSYLRNQTLFANSPSAAPQIFHTYKRQRFTQCPAMAIDKKGVAYFGLVHDTTINCWNTLLPYGSKNIDVLSRNRINYQFVSGIKVIINGAGFEELWFNSMRFQKLATGTMNINETNFRIQSTDLKKLIRGSKCALPFYNN